MARDRRAMGARQIRNRRLSRPDAVDEVAGMAEILGIGIARRVFQRVRSQFGGRCARNLSYLQSRPTHGMTVCDAGDLTLRQGIGVGCDSKALAIDAEGSAASMKRQAIRRTFAASRLAHHEGNR